MKLHLPNPFALGALCLWAAALFLASTLPARSQSDLFLMVSQPGDPIGEGHLYVTTNLAEFQVSTAFGALQVNAFGYQVSAIGPTNQPLAVGDYTNAQRYPFNWSSPGLSVWGRGNGCNTSCGGFHVYEWEQDARGNPTRLWLTFTQYCECYMVPLTGEIRYHSLLAPPVPLPRTLRVPADYPTIQAAIDASSVLAYDTILVGPGAYNEALQFGGHSVRVQSTDGPATTWICPPQGGDAVSFIGQSAGAVLCGFTITNGGVTIFYASPAIVSNVIVRASTGINVSTGSPVLQYNTLQNCWNQGVHLTGTGSARVEGNLILTNGDGMVVDEVDTPVIVNNRIQGNARSGITLYGLGASDILQNVIVGNGTEGIHAAPTFNPVGPRILNNTIVGNGGAGISLGENEGTFEVLNNVVEGSPALQTLSYGDSNTNTRVLLHNDFWSKTGPLLDGNFPGLFDDGGNLSTNPGFACPPEGDYHLTALSPCIDAGTNEAGLWADDGDGNPRVLAGQPGQPAVVDLGAFEFNPAAPPVPCLFVECPPDLVVIDSTAQGAAVVNLQPLAATPGAIVTCSPPSGAVFPTGTNLVTCTVTSATNSASCTFQVLVLSAPLITQQPQDVSVKAGTSFTLSVVAAGTAPLSYVWLQDGIPVYWGNGGPTLTVSDAQAGNEGVYTVRISNVAGAVTSSPARVQVLPAKPGIVADPVSMTVGASSNTFFSVTAQGAEPLSYQWYHNHSPIPLGVGPALFLRNVQASDAGKYWVQVSNALGRTNSASATLTVLPKAPYFVVQPMSASLLAGQPLILQSAAAGSEPLGYQWFFQGRRLPHQTRASLVVSRVTPASAGAYFVVVTNRFGRATSLTADVTVARAPRPLHTLRNRVVQAGQNVTLAFPATGDRPLHYAWERNGVALPSTNATLVLSNVQPQTAGYFRAIAANWVGSASAVARVSVVEAPSRLVVWGDNSKGQTNLPSGMSRIIAAAGGELDGCALRANGTLARWGTLPSGGSNAPAHKLPLVALAAGAHHCLALDAGGNIYAWGDNFYDQCRIPISATEQPLSLSAGEAHSLALLADGSVVGWGGNTYGQITLPEVLNRYTYSYSGWGWEPNPNYQTARAVAAGGRHSLALLESGSVAAWGDNTYGQLNVPPDLTNATAVAAGSLHNVALRADGTVVAWGDNTYGQLSVPSGLGNVVAVAAGAYHTLALLRTGQVVGWGDNSRGQLEIPSAVTNAVGIACGYYHSMALLPKAATPKSH